MPTQPLIRTYHHRDKSIQNAPKLRTTKTSKEGFRLYYKREALCSRLGHVRACTGRDGWALLAPSTVDGA